jgi:hypothetical protein
MRNAGIVLGRGFTSKFFVVQFNLLILHQYKVKEKGYVN